VYRALKTGIKSSVEYGIINHKILEILLLLIIKLYDISRTEIKLIFNKKCKFLLLKVFLNKKTVIIKAINIKYLKFKPTTLISMTRILNTV
jgi:hypothetical protein